MREWIQKGIEIWRVGDEYREKIHIYFQQKEKINDLKVTLFHESYRN